MNFIGSTRGDGDFNAAANWLVSDVEEALTGPTVHDTIRSMTVGCSETSDRTLTLGADAIVSNLSYNVSTKVGKLTLDLNDKVLTVDSDLSLSTRGNDTEGDELYVRDGTIRVVQSFPGTKTQYGQMNEDRSGFFVNRMNAQNAGLKAVFDNVDIDVLSANQTVFNFYWLYGGNHYMVFTNGSTLACTNLQIKTDPNQGSAKIVFDGVGTSLYVDDRGELGSAAGRAKFDAALSGDSEVEFRNGASLHAGQLKKTGGATLFLRGGVHHLRSINDWGNWYSMNVSAGTLAVTNGTDGGGALLEYEGKIRINDSGRLYVGPDCLVSNVADNIELFLGHLDSGTTTGGGILDVDGGTVVAPWLRFGGKVAGSNAVVRIRGAHARIEQKKAQAWGADSPMTVNYGCGLEFVLPPTGFQDEDGNARAPIYAAGCIATTTADGVRPIYIRLNTRAFDKARPEQTITLIQATEKTNRVGSDTSLFYAELLKTVIWDNSSHGTLSVSDDGKSLLYTAPEKSGLVLIFR